MSCILIVGAGKTDGAMDAGNMLKPMLARGELHCIGATTLDEYRKYIEKDAGAGASFPAGHGGRAERGGYDFHSAWLKGALRSVPRRQDHWTVRWSQRRHLSTPLHFRPVPAG